MAMELTPTTELEAVNAALISIGNTPVNTLAVTGMSDTSIALTTLRDVCREVLSREWYFNTDDDYALTPDVDGICKIPPNLLKMKRASSESRKLIPRMNKVYDLEAKSYVFAPTSPPLIKAIWMFTFEHLPETFRRYITIRAARIFQTSVVGSETLHSFTELHEIEARVAVLNEENEMNPANFLSDSQDVSEIWSR